MAADPQVADPRDRMPRWVPRAIALAWVAAIGFLAFRWLIAELRNFFIVILVSLFLSFAIEPAVNRLERMGVRRGLGTLGVFGGVVLFVAIFSFAIGALLADQVSQFVDEAPEYITDIEVWLEDSFGVELDTDNLANEFQADGAATSFATRLAGNLVDLGSQAVGLAFNLLTIALFTFYLVADGPRLRRVICGLLPPDRQRQVLSTWDLAIEKTGGYIYSRAILAIISAIVHWAAFAAIDLPFPIPLALWVGLISQFIPVVGTYIAGFLPFVIALLDNPRDAIAVLVIIVVYQQIENYLLAPRITAQTMEIHVAVAFGAVLVGGALLGVVGALLALPAAAMLQALVSSSVEHHDLIEELHKNRQTGLPFPGAKPD